MELQPLLFWIVAALTAASAVGVVVTQNIVRAAAFLVFALGGTAGIFFLLGADFVGATQLLVYVGGTLVLVVFGVMLTAQGPFISMKTGAAEWAVALVVGLLLYGVIAFTVVRSGLANDFRAGQEPLPADAAATSTNSELIGEGLLGVTEATPNANLTGMPKDRPAPARTKMGYLLPFEIVSVHLLVVLIGAAYLARAKRRRLAPLAPGGRGVGGEGDVS
jgi:NADH:ubiquinone oxidoreductase subunit 6 (subunit J)